MKQTSSADIANHYWLLPPYRTLRHDLEREKNSALAFGWNRERERERERELFSHS